MDWELLKRMISLETTREKRAEVAPLMERLLKDAAERRGLEFRAVKDSAGILNFLISKPGKGKKVLFLTHYDVVLADPKEWSFPPFEPREDKEKIYGRGAADNKSNILAVLEAMAEVDDPAVEPVLVIVGGEETGESEEFMRSLEGDLVVVVDSGPESVSFGASGIVRFELTVKGVSGHSAYPFRADNAIYKAAEILKKLETLGNVVEKTFVSKYPAYHYGRLPVRLSATIIRGGIAGNIIPGECRITVDIRTVPEYNSDFMEEWFKKISESWGVEVKVIGKMEAWVSEGPHVDAFAECVKAVTGEEPARTVELGGTDGVHFYKRMPVVQFGTLREGTNYHGANEFVWKKDVELVKKVIAEFMRRGW